MDFNFPIEKILEEQDAEKAKKTIADRSGAAPRAGIKRGESFTFRWSDEAKVNELIKSIVAGKMREKERGSEWELVVGEKIF